MITQCGRTLIVLVSMYLFAAATVMKADLVSPEVADAWKRYEENSKAFDRADQYCVGKKPRASCVIPGSTFEGGGPGKCKRSVSQGSEYISLECERSEVIQIDRQVPNSSFRMDDSLCSNPELHLPYVCTEPAVVTDRFCANHQVRQSCTVELTRAGKKETAAGICSLGVDVVNFYQYGRQKAYRPILTCEPLHPVPEQVFKPVSQWRKFLQW